ncbi:bromo adjacent homology domain-containing 1 protein-like isoform X1 [Salvelinus fontinalis]|uniref:bromo adjacent homology domain-containing 1 protein-like isoform X1 n=1 Tax=Salvelinus fontinalis TaxID=8038 RepID=UPI00248654FF|nr:bromo adjacent homology domain-containing 1 protein-like isoform X1 [Salvelinus fontinalis]XP_055741367.1 bromo adjacent homology domain-containing 1 protein-like isoform X1 [Salvelinus fontinalis]XP_055741369.1 bromo adjacent homology domain-containing 1 protein-like isoform X1 [Salvelinus fontinalis]
MTHAQNKGSLSQSRSTVTREHCPDRSHGETMGGAWPERTLRFGRTMKKGGTKRGRGGVKEMMDRREKTPERNRRRSRKSYPLRGRGGAPEEEGLSCHVLLTRLEKDIQEQEDTSERGNDSPIQPPVKPESRSKKLDKGKDKAKGKLLAKKMIPKTKSKTTSDEQGLPFPEPRKRRLASLNAEAVNSLLLERPNETQPASKQARRQQDEHTSGESFLGTDPARRGVTGGPNAPRTSSKAYASHKPDPCQSSRKTKKVSKKPAKPDRGQKKEMMTLQMLHTPAPRRLAGLNAAALLKLTSTSATSKQRVKTTSTTTTMDCKATSTASVDVEQKQPQPRPNLKPCSRQPKQKGRQLIPEEVGCSACKKSNFEPKVEWESGGCTHRLTKPGYQSRSMLAYPLKPVVKEEQVEAELSPYYCCPPEGSVEYCHRLALFLGQQAYADSEERPLNSALTSVKRECLVTSPSHPHSHAALTLSPHPCLCTADPACFSSYYVHIAHPTHPGAPSANLSSRPLNFGSSTLCPGRVSGSKLLGPPVSHSSTLSHPAFCGSVGTPCYSEACRVSGYTYRAMQPVNSRGCSFSTGCSGCTHSIKTEGYSSPQGDHNPSLLVSPSLPLSGCPLPTTPSSTQAKPRLLTPLSDRSVPQARLKLARECPQGSKPPNGSLSMGRTRLSQKQPAPTPSLSPAKQKRVNHRRATNGWLPVGVPTEKEVFIAGEDETALRQCYEGVQRDGEVIRVRDTVLLRAGPRKKSLPYVAKISALWEDPKSGELMMSLFWYYRPEHTQGVRDPSMHCENEIFASRHQDENSVACIEDRCYVLPLAQYCRFCALVKRRAEGVPPGAARVVPCPSDFDPPDHRQVPADIDPELVYLCRHVYDFRYGRILKNLQ